MRDDPRGYELKRNGARATTPARRHARISMTESVPEEPSVACMEAVQQIKRVHDLRENRSRRLEIELFRVSRLLRIATENAERARAALADARDARRSGEAALDERYAGRCVSVAETSVWRESLRAELARVEQAEVASREAAAAIETHQRQCDRAQTEYREMLRKLEKTDCIQAWLLGQTES